VFLAGAAVVALAAVSAFVLFRGQHATADQAMTAAPVADGPVAA